MSDEKNIYGGIGESFRFLERYDSKWPKLVFMLLLVLIFAGIGVVYSVTEKPGYTFLVGSLAVLVSGTMLSKAIIEKIFG
ncbi:MAG: hypothetical protein WC657_08265 [Candidatus Paceibacterota bacterium]|jgi:hypothetical protein